MTPRGREGGGRASLLTRGISVQVAVEALAVDGRGAGASGADSACPHELARQRPKLATRYAVASHDERLTSIERAHDLAAADPELALGDRLGHGITVVRVLRRSRARCPGVFLRPRRCLPAIEE